MAEILAGGAILIGVLVLVYGFVNTSPRTLTQLVRYAGVGVLTLISGGLLYTRNIILGLFFGSLAWGLYTNGHIWPARNFWFMPFGFALRTAYRPRTRRRGPQAGQASHVATAWIEVELNHDSGEMGGKVLKGTYADRSLAALSPEQLLSLYREAGPADAETARLLEAYLDRRLGPEWRLKQEQRQQSEPGAKPGRNRDSGMARDEAYSVLGLSAGASEIEIRAAHRRLMMQNHPDHGGSSYIASKINEAKDVLLG